MDDRTQRPCRNGSATNPDCEMLERRQHRNQKGHGQGTNRPTGHVCASSRQTGTRGGDVTDTRSARRSRTDESGSEEGRLREHVWRTFAGLGASAPDRAGCGRWQGFPTVSPVHRGNDGLPFDVDDLTIPFSKWRTEALKAYGNAIVPQVMYEIFRAIELTYNAN